MTSLQKCDILFLIGDNGFRQFFFMALAAKPVLQSRTAQVARATFLEGYVNQCKVGGNMITMMEVEMLASILSRVGVNQVEAAWCNGVLDKLRALAAAAELEQKAKEADDD